MGEQEYETRMADGKAERKREGIEAAKRHGAWKKTKKKKKKKKKKAKKADNREEL